MGIATRSLVPRYVERMETRESMAAAMIGRIDANCLKPRGRFAASLRVAHTAPPSLRFPDTMR
jgi:hypothetical protein